MRGVVVAVVAGVLGVSAGCARRVDLPSASHAYFEVPVATMSAGYRVLVFAFDTSRRK